MTVVLHVVDLAFALAAAFGVGLLLRGLVGDPVARLFGGPTGPAYGTLRVGDLHLPIEEIRLRPGALALVARGEVPATPQSGVVAVCDPNGGLVITGGYLALGSARPGSPLEIAYALPLTVLDQ